MNAAVTNSSQCSPGASPGSLQINGDYTQTPSGQLNIEIGGTIPGTSFDQINISGTANLASPDWLDVATGTNAYYASPTESEGYFRLIQP